MNDEKRDGHNRGRTIAFWIPLLRGFFVIILGLVLIFNPEKTKPMLANFMGFFWLTSGILLIRHSHAAFGKQTDRVLGKRMSLVFGLIGILTGLMVVIRSITRRWLGEVVSIELLGAVILLTGVMHMFEEFRIDRVVKLKRTAAQKILAIFEIVLGALLVISPLDQGPIIYWTATIWALIGGGLIISDTLYQRAQVNRIQETQEKPAEIGEE